MKRKIMAWLLSGIMMLQPVAGVQAAEFSDEVVGYFRIISGNPRQFNYRDESANCAYLHS